MWESRYIIWFNLILHSQRGKHFSKTARNRAITYVEHVDTYVWKMVCFSFAWFKIYDSRFDILVLKRACLSSDITPTRATPASRYPCGNSNFKQSGEFPLCSQRNVCNCYAWISVTGLLLRCWLDGALGTWNVLWPISTYSSRLFQCEGDPTF